VLARIDADIEKSTDRLLDLLRIRSISTDPAYAEDCQKAADWLVRDLESLGAVATKRQTPGHPMVVGHVDGAGPRHRDPFDPAVEQTPKGPVIRGRGSSDDKGQLMTFVEACRAWKAVHGTLPCKVTFFFEGEEESGSPSLIPFMKGRD